MSLPTRRYVSFLRPCRSVDQLTKQGYDLQLGTVRLIPLPTLNRALYPLCRTRLHICSQHTGAARARSSSRACPPISRYPSTGTRPATRPRARDVRAAEPVRAEQGLRHHHRQRVCVTCGSCSARSNRRQSLLGPAGSRFWAWAEEQVQSSPSAIELVSLR